MKFSLKAASIPVLVALMSVAACPPALVARTSGDNRSPVGVTRHESTNWQLMPSIKFDVLCLLNVLSADPFYLKYYQKDYDELSPRLTPKAREALANLRRKIKEENKGIISAFLTLYFSATEDETLEDMLATLEHPGALQDSLKTTPYYSDSGWALFESVRGDLQTVLRSLRDSGFEQYWSEKIQPKARQKISEIEPRLPQYNVIREVEQALGEPLDSDRITVYVLYYSQPHGIKITGTRFLTDVAWPFEIVLRNAVHEMLHPPFDLTKSPELRTALDSLRADRFLMDKVENHNPAFGYNSFEGLVEEDCVQALEQRITEKWGIARDAKRRWKENDDGIHVFAVALYSVMERERFGETGESFRSFLTRVIQAGILSPGSIRKFHRVFYGEREMPAPGDGRD